MAKQTEQAQVKELNLNMKSGKTAELTKEDICRIIGKESLGNPIYGRELGVPFTVELTGNIVFREYEGNKSAYLTTKSGYSIKVNDSYDQNIHSEGKKFQAVAKEATFKDREGKERTSRYCAFAFVD